MPFRAVSVWYLYPTCILGYKHEAGYIEAYVFEINAPAFNRGSTVCIQTNNRYCMSLP